MPYRFLALLAALYVSAITTPLHAQGASASPLESAEAALKKNAAKILMRFASTAKSRKYGQKEKAAYELILNSYNSNDNRVRRALNYKMEAKEWKLIAPKKRRTWADKADRKGRFQVQQEWRKARLKLCEEHQKLGLEMLKGGSDFLARGKAHLRQAIQYNPMDKVSHLALGHKPTTINGVDYYGNDTEVTFINRMKVIETFALMLAKKTYDPQPVPALPVELQKTGLEMYGAKTKNFTVFVRGTQENADDVVEWCERALDFLDFVVGDSHTRTKQLARRRMAAWGWIGILWTEPEMRKFLNANPSLVKDRQGKYFNLNFQSNKKTCQVAHINMPSYMHDFLIAHVFHYGLGSGNLNNIGLLEGIHHAATWFLKSTCFAKFGAEPKGTVSSKKKSLPEGANWWLREMRNQAIAGNDVPLNVVPRTELYKFHADVRLKTWSFGVWAMARFPDTWLNFARKCPHNKIPFPSEIDAIGAKVFGIPLEQVEAEWRQWASGRGVSAAATGYGPPLLPEFPNNDEIEGLERLNAVRGAVTCWAAPVKRPAKTDKGSTKGVTINAPPNQWNKVLPQCELDSEATAACKDHAKFFGKHEEHWKWPEAHEEDPAKEGFTPRGMRAGLRSVIVWSTGSMDATKAIDSWIGTVYHRFPLLEYNIKRFGIAYDNTGKCEVIVLDMGSLQEPRDQELEIACGLIAWPPSGMKRVPRQFSYTEHPNPLADVGLDFEAQKDTGYPVSLQFSKLIIQNTTQATMMLYEAKKRGNGYEAGDRVPCWLHTPDKPLLKRMVMRNVVFVIPKAVLKSKQAYKAVVKMTVGGGPKVYEWVFTTGSKMQGLGKLR